MVGQTITGYPAPASLAQGAWVPMLRGVVAILLGLTAFLSPGITLAVLVALFGVYAFVQGILALISAFRMAGRHSPWLGLLFEGIVGIAAAIVTFRTPGLTAIALLYVVAAWAIFIGILQLITAIELREIIPGEWLQAVSGLLSIVLGWLLFARPGPGLLTLIWVVGIYAIVYGVVMFMLGIMMHRLGDETSGANPKLSGT